MKKFKLQDAHITAKKRDCEIGEIQHKLCETHQVLWKTICMVDDWLCWLLCRNSCRCVISLLLSINNSNHWQNGWRTKYLAYCLHSGKYMYHAYWDNLYVQEVTLMAKLPFLNMQFDHNVNLFVYKMSYLHIQFVCFWISMSDEFPKSELGFL